MSTISLSRQLFIRIAPTLLLTILVIGGFAFYSAHKEIKTVYDAQLISNANVLWTLISDEIDDEMNASGETNTKKVEDIDLGTPNQLATNDSADDYADSRMFRVWQAGKIIMYSDTAPPSSIAKQPDGFSTIDYQGTAWRIYALPIPHKQVTIEVGETLALRDKLVLNILLNLALPLLLLVPVVGLLLWFGIIHGLGAIWNLVEQIRRRSPDDLSPVHMDILPRDLVPLGKSLNQLFIKLAHSFTAEKRFTDHAAHQLKTPQATIKLQLQMLAKATSEEEKNELMHELMQSNERAGKLISMLLTSARLNHQPVLLESVPVYAATGSVMAELGLLAKEKRIEMSLEGDEHAQAMADETLFKLMISNIIDNAIKYTPVGGTVQVTIESQAQGCKLSICDTGCGISEAERVLVFERFYRVETPEEEGTGLGLALVADIIARLNGSIALKTPDSGIGLLVEVVLPIQ